MKKPEKLTYEGFAKVKTEQMMIDAWRMVNNEPLKHGRVNSDFDGYAFRAKNDGEVELEVVGMDFEYFNKDPERAKEILERSRKNAEDMYLFNRINHSGWPVKGDVERIHQAAYLAMRYLGGEYSPTDEVEK